MDPQADSADLNMEELPLHCQTSSLTSILSYICKETRHQILIIC